LGTRRTCELKLARRRVSAQLTFKRPDDLMLGAVKLQCRDGGPTIRRDANDPILIPAEVMIPVLHPWMEEPDEFASIGIPRGLTSTLSQ
jgi:hypothetical protein